jgi:hypothetical protein
VIEAGVVAVELIVVGVLECGGEFVEEVEKLGGSLIGEFGFGKAEGRFVLIHGGHLVV